MSEGRFSIVQESSQDSTEQTGAQFLQECKKKLLYLKADLLNRSRDLRLEISAQEKATGDEIDQLMAQQQENDFVNAQQRLHFLMMEIEFALARIATGTYGICEETEEAIEMERLRAIPYTRLSIEGAEIREALKTKFAR